MKSYLDYDNAWTLDTQEVLKKGKYKKNAEIFRNKTNGQINKWWMFHPIRIYKKMNTKTPYLLGRYNYQTCLLLVSYMTPTWRNVLETSDISFQHKTWLWKFCCAEILCKLFNIFHVPMSSEFPNTARSKCQKFLFLFKLQYLTTSIFWPKYIYAWRCK